MTIKAGSFTKIDQHHNNFTRGDSRSYRDRGQRQENPDRLRTNQIEGFFTEPSWEKINDVIIMNHSLFDVFFMNQLP